VGSRGPAQIRSGVGRDCREPTLRVDSQRGRMFPHSGSLTEMLSRVVPTLPLLLRRAGPPALAEVADKIGLGIVWQVFFIDDFEAIEAGEKGPTWNADIIVSAAVVGSRADHYEFGLAGWVRDQKAPETLNVRHKTRIPRRETPLRPNHRRSPPRYQRPHGDSMPRSWRVQ
jgi:hypothetical protein